MEKIPNALAAYINFLILVLEYAVKDNKKSTIDKNVADR